MHKIYNSNIIPFILKYFKIKKIIVSGVKDKDLINSFLNYSANYTFINTSEINSEEVINGDSLGILSNLSDYDAIFIDDDPNWYTIFSELNIIKKTNSDFPVVFICNNKFPHKRRDSYFNPSSIPKEFRHQCTKELPVYYNNEKITILDGFYHSCEENTSKNGVLTGIEDFLNENSHIGKMKINFIEDITILYNKIPINQKRIEIIYDEINGYELKDVDLSSKLIENNLLLSHINNNFREYELEISNKDDVINDFELEISNKDDVINNYEDKIKIFNEEIYYKNSKINGFENKLKLKDTKIKDFESKLVNKEKTIDSLQNDLSKKELNLKDIESELVNKEKTIDSLQNDLSKKESYVMDKEMEFNSQISNLNKQLTSQFSKIEHEKYCINCFKEEINNNRTEINYLKSNTLTRNILSPFSYLYLVLKSKPKEVFINLKLLKILKSSKCFDIGFYLENNPDIKKSDWCKYFSPELHYVCKGFEEERTFNKKYFNRNSKRDLLNYLLNCEK